MIRCGIDIGGTNIKFGFFNDVNPEPKAFYEFYIKTPKDQDKIVPAIINAIKSKKNSDLIEKYSVCIPGEVNNDVVVFAPNTNIVGLNLYKLLSEGLGCNDIFIENDANLAALAEARATNTKDLVLITLGTGVGGGIVLDDKLYNKNAFAGEIGHIKVEFGPKARHCTCGGYGCAEAYTSAKNMPLEYNKRHHKNLNSVELFDLYKKGDPDAIKNVEHFARYLGILIADINQVLCVNEFRIGGGLSHAGDLFIDKVRKYYKMNAIPTLKDSCNISIAKLSNGAGICAALYI